jgi:hypothetical protein
LCRIEPPPYIETYTDNQTDTTLYVGLGQKRETLGENYSSLDSKNHINYLIEDKRSDTNGDCDFIVLVIPLNDFPQISSFALRADHIDCH